MGRAGFVMFGVISFMASAEFRSEFERLKAGRNLNEVDSEAVKAVAGLTVRIRDARDLLDNEGVVTSTDRGVLIEHPAAKVERMASAEIRGWVKDRPDLFGERGKKSADDSFDDKPQSGKEKFGGFTLVR